MTITRTRLAAALLAALLAAAPAEAGGRWLIGLDGLQSRVEDNNAEDAHTVEEQGSGAALQIGYHLNPNFMLRIYGGGSDHALTDSDVELVFAGGLIEGVYLFRAGRDFRPYVFGGIGGFAIDSQQETLEYEAEGAGMGFGIGAYYALGRTVHLHGSLRLEAVNWEKVSATVIEPDGSRVTTETPVEESGLASKVTFGLVFRL